MKRTCEERQFQISLWLDDALLPAEIRELETHLERCDGCRAYLATLRRFEAAARAMPAVLPPADLSRRVLAQVATLQMWQRYSRLIILLALVTLPPLIVVGGILAVAQWLALTSWLATAEALVEAADALRAATSLLGHGAGLALWLISLVATIVNALGYVVLNPYFGGFVLLTAGMIGCWLLVLRYAQQRAGRLPTAS